MTLDSLDTVVRSAIRCLVAISIFGTERYSKQKVPDVNISFLRKNWETKLSTYYYELYMLHTFPINYNSILEALIAFNFLPRFIKTTQIPLVDENSLGV